MRPTDTSAKVFDHQIERYRQLGPAGRSRIAAELSDALRETSLAAMRRRHPEHSESEIRRAFVDAVYRIDIRR
jgi:hypothetical protein